MARPTVPVLDRLADGVEFADSGCWLWSQTRPNGYSRLTMPTGKSGGRSELAHRVMWETVVGPIPKGLVLDHLCKTLRCINPDHLEPVTQRENLRRSNNPVARYIKEDAA